jgi:hypothetical protein
VGRLIGCEMCMAFGLVFLLYFLDSSSSDIRHLSDISDIYPT